MDIILFGMQGSGKGTQSKFFAEKFGFKIFEMGSTLRAMVASGSELGNQIKAVIESGELVSDKTIMQVVENFLETQAKGAPVLFDGIPRTMVQRDKLLELLQAHDRQAHGIYIEVSEDEAIERMLSRGRSDDNLETIRRRVDNYKSQTEPVIQRFQAEGRLTEVNGNQGIEAVTVELMEKMNPILSHE